MSLLSIHNVCKSYGNVKALTDFSAELDCGVYALLGPNGSGKSTLMNILTDNLAMDSGEILYNGKAYIRSARSIALPSGLCRSILACILHFRSMIA